MELMGRLPSHRHEGLVSDATGKKKSFQAAEEALKKLEE
jgi:hypothetical protein